MKKLLFAVVLLVVAGVVVHDGAFVQDITSPSTPAVSQSTGDSVLARADETRASDLQVEGKGQVIRVLPDDNDGSRHQRFILELGSGQTLLVAHNIDLAPRIQLLQVGDTVAFFGEYEWNAQGGVIHWTHHDPQRRHTGGWLRHQGRVYQ